MVTIDDILAISTADEQSRLALEVFRMQAQNVAPYKEYLGLIGVDPISVKHADDIPYLPIALFKSHKILMGDSYEHIFTSSGTSSQQTSSHYVKSLEVYRKSFMSSFAQFCFDPKEAQIFALLPGYLEREGSSLIYMIKELIAAGSGGGFYLYDYDKLRADIAARDTSKKLLLFGVTFALLDMVENGGLRLQSGDIVMETGGMKGRRRELPREELHKILCDGFGVDQIASEYGMCECLSQAYSMGEGVFTCPAWMKISLRDTQNPFAKANGRGAVNIMDLANLYSCSFLQSDDVATMLPNGDFRIEGRLDGSDIRGCNLLVSNI